MNKILMTGAAAFGMALSAPAMADIVQVDANSITNTNVLFNGADQSNNIVQGVLNNAFSTPLTFTGAGGAILRASGGQASITGDLDGATNSPNDTLELFGLSFGLTSNATFGNVEVNLFKGTADAVTFTLVDDGGAVFTFDNLALGNGQNRFGFAAVAGQSIRSVAFATIGGGIQDVRQVRVGLSAGTTPGNPDAVPEPATWALLLGGFGMIGAAARRRTRTSVTYA